MFVTSIPQFTNSPIHNFFHQSIYLFIVFFLDHPAFFKLVNWCDEEKYDIDFLFSSLISLIVNANPFEEQEEVFEREGKKTVGGRIFEIFDKDGDGIVSIADMVKLIKSIGLSYQGNKIRQKIEQAYYAYFIISFLDLYAKPRTSLEMDVTLDFDCFHLVANF